MRALTVEPVRESGAKGLADVQDQDHRNGIIGRQRAQDLDHRRRPAGRRADHDDTAFRRCGSENLAEDGLLICRPSAPIRSRGCVITLIRETSFTADRNRCSHTPSASSPVGFSSTSTAPAASAS